MTDLSRDALKILQNKTNIKEFGKLLNEQWKLKRFKSTFNKQPHRSFIQNGSK